MDPKITNISVDDEMFKFTLSGVNVSLANTIRRTILNDIPTTVIYTETYKDNQCNIEINTTRLHNEIIKQRMVPYLSILMNLIYCLIIIYY